MSFHFLPHLVLRCPTFSYQDYNPEEISRVLTDDNFITAIYLSNREFYNTINNKGFNFNLLNEKEKLTLQNYYNRISFRTTPFGTFSSFSYLLWDLEKSDSQIELKKTNLHFLADQHYKQMLIGQTRENFTAAAQYIINPTLYKQGKNYRFIKTLIKDKSTAYSYSLTTFQSTQILSKIIAAFKNQSVTASQLLVYIVDSSGCTDIEGMDFIVFLDDSQIILKNNLPGVLGKDNVWLSNQSEAKTWQQLRLVDGAIGQLNNKISPGLKDIKALETTLKNLLPANDDKIKSYCYVNLEKTAENGLDKHYQDKLAEIIEATKVLLLPTSNEMLKSFADKFEKRFEKKALPLLDALDPITGLSYGSSSSGNNLNSLLENIRFAENNTPELQIGWTPVQRFFLKKLTQKSGLVLEITDTDIAGLKTDSIQKYPASMSVIFNIVNGTVIMGGAGGVSANAIIGRFTPFNKSLLNAAQDIARQENENNAGVIFAEIHHLSDSHIDNINRRFPVYEYEIAINAMPVTGVKRIPLSDLYVRVINNEIILESKTLKKRVIPRLTTAYNHQRNDLNVFRFLSDLQYQNISYDFDVSLEKVFPDLEHYPRIEYKGSILSLAKWVISQEVIKKISGSSIQKNLAALKTYREENNIPANISLGSSDKQLFFDLADDNGAALFIANIKTDKKAIIKEFIWPKTTCAVKNGKSVIGQFVAFIINSETTYAALDNNLNKDFASNKRDFNLGSEWLYLKIYCSTLVTNNLINDKISPLMDKMIGKKADKWFFVRYYDNYHHLRLRIHITDHNPDAIIAQLHNALKDSLDANLIQEYRADTYHRELERYGGDIIDTVETVFFKSSVVVSSYLKKLSNDTYEHSYYAYGFISTLKMLEMFIYNDEDRANYTGAIAANFMKEFGGDKQLKVDLDKKYREMATWLSEIGNYTAFFSSLGVRQKQIQYEKAFALLLEKIRGQPFKKQGQLVADMIHMHLNRVFSEEQRKHEMIIYYCLSKKFRSDLARMKCQKNLIA